MTINIENREDFYKLIDHKEYRLCVEIGVQRGNFSEYLLKSNSLTKLYLIDCWAYQDNYLDMANISNAQQQSYYQYVNQRFSQNSRVKIIREFSTKACELFEDGSLDFIYLDADHSYEAIKKDIEIWYPKLRTGGTLAGHDYFDGVVPQGNFGVKTAVNEFIEKHNYKLNITNESQWQSWYFLK
jgi:hypothetical protein